MQTMAPPDTELKQRFARVDERFDEVNRRITEGREESRHRFDRVEGEIRELRQGMERLHASIQHGNFALIAALLGVIVATFLKGG